MIILVLHLFYFQLMYHISTMSVSSIQNSEISLQALLHVDEDSLSPERLRTLAKIKRVMLLELQALVVSGSPAQALLKRATEMRRVLQEITGTAQTQFHSEQTGNSRALSQVASRIKTAAARIEPHPPEDQPLLKLSMVVGVAGLGASAAMAVDIMRTFHGDHHYQSLVDKAALAEKHLQEATRNVRAYQEQLKSPGISTHKEWMGHLKADVRASAYELKQAMLAVWEHTAELDRQALKKFALGAMLGGPIGWVLGELICAKELE